MISLCKSFSVFRLRRDCHYSTSVHFSVSISSFISVRFRCRQQYSNTNSMVVVQVEEGMLRGVEKKSIITGKSFCAFSGIPYAEPPIGDLRFKAPIPKAKWDGVREALKEESECIHVNLITGKPEVIGTEDCLYLNVYTPQVPSEIKSKTAVMVFIHGGGFCTGSGSEKLYGPDYLVSHNVIFVTMNYRLHVLGFLNTGTSNCSGNAGLKDQLLAIKWVRKNITSFGGDPENITLFGESAGASSVHLHMLSPLSKGLFGKAILQSGTALSPWAIEEDPKSRARKFGHLAGYEGDDLEGLVEYLKTQSARRLCELANQCHEDAKLNTPGCCCTLVFVPSVEKIVEGAFLPDFPEKLMKFAPCLPTIVGYNDLEGLLVFLTQIPQYVGSLLNDLSIVVKNNFHLNESDQAELLVKIKEFYFQNKKLSPECTPQIVDLYTDLYFIKFYEAIDYLIQSNVPPYIYLFTHDGKVNFLKNIIRNFVDLKMKGAAHGDDLGYLFSQTFLPMKPDETDKEVINHCCTLWTNFAKSGYPTADLSHIEWKSHTEKNPCYLQIDKSLKVFNEKLSEERLGFWKNWSANFRR